jgi:hypothetical protein
MDFQNKMLSSLVTFIEVGKFRHFDECHYVAKSWRTQIEG